MISLSAGFEPIPEGVHIFKITKVEYNPDFGKMLVTMKTKAGKTHIEKFGLLDKKGEPNPGAMSAFSYFAKAAMNDFDLEEIEEQDLVGHYIKATVEHNIVESNKTPGKMLTFVQLGDKEPASCFEGEEDGFLDTTPAKAQEEAEEDDLLASLGL